MSEERKPQADANSGFDDLFRSALKSHQIEPSGSIWRGISRKLLRAELARFNFRNLPKTFWIGTAGVALVGLILLFNQIPDGSTSENEPAPPVIRKGMDGNAASAQEAKAIQSDPKTLALTGKASAPIISPVRPVQQTQAPSGPPLLASNNASRTLKANKAGSTSLVTGKTVPTQYVSDNQRVFNRLYEMPSGRNSRVEFTYLPPLNSSALIPSDIEDTMLRFSNIYGITNIPLVTKVRPSQFFTFNVGISPEVSMYRNADKYSETNYWLNTGITYHAGKFSVQSGVGLGYVFDHAKYRVNYKSKDSIGYFTSIVSFIVTQGNIIVYTTKDIPVYDSLQHIVDDRTVSRYTYLQVPLMLGYELVQTNRFSLGIKAGPILSFLIGSKEASPFIDYPNARLIRVENNTFTRVKMNWEIQAALDLEYRLVRNFSLYAQPYYKHYFKPFETGESPTTPAKDPYSVGIEVGARFNFGQKRIKP